MNDILLSVEPENMKEITGYIDVIKRSRASGWMDLRAVDRPITDIRLHVGAFGLAGSYAIVDRPDVSTHLGAEGAFGLDLRWPIEAARRVLEDDLRLCGPGETIDATIVVTCDDGSRFRNTMKVSRDLRTWRDLLLIDTVGFVGGGDQETDFVGTVETVSARHVSGWVIPRAVDDDCHVSLWLDGSLICEERATRGTRRDLEVIAPDGRAHFFALDLKSLAVAKGLARAYRAMNGIRETVAELKCLVSFRPSTDGRLGVASAFSLPIETTRTLADWFEFFDVDLSDEMATARRAAYDDIASVVGAAADRARIEEEFLVAGMVAFRRSAPATFRSSRESLVERYFDSTYYRALYGDEPGASIDPLRHYLAEGAAKDFVPHPLFSPTHFRAQLAKANTHPEHDDPFAHFLKYHRYTDADPHPLFDRAWYRRRYGLPAQVNEWVDYVEGGWRFGREPNALFLQRVVVEAVPGSRRTASPVSPLETYVQSSDCAALTPHPLLPKRWSRADYVEFLSSKAAQYKSSRDFLLFDGGHYRRQARISNATIYELVRHYFIEGERRGLEPNLFFDPHWYRRTHGWVSDLEGPLVHYLTTGERMGWSPSPLFDTRRYVEANNDVMLAGMTPLTHFVLRQGAESQRRPSRRFDSRWFATVAPKGFGNYAAFLRDRLIEPIPPHPALIVSPRAAQSDLKALLTCTADDREPMPFGVASVFVGDRRDGRGAVMARIDDYENEVASGDAATARRLRMDEPISRMNESFDFRVADEVIATAPEIDGPPPLVSVVIPVRNRAGIILTAVQSILVQTYQNFEILVVDDGSTDGTAAVVGGVQDERVRVVQGSQKGVSAARNLGLEAARGTYVAYLDSDNTWERTYLATMIRLMVAEKVDCAHAGLRVFSPAGKILYRGDVYDREALDRENYIDMNVFVHHRRLIDDGHRFDETLRRCVDWDFIRRACLVVGPSRYVPIIGCNYLDDDSLGRITTHEAQGDFFRLCVAQIALDRHVVGLERSTPPSYAMVWPLHRSDANHALAQLWAAARHLRRGDHELIVVANGVTDDVTLALDAMAKRVEGLRVVHLWRSFYVTPAVMIGFRLARADRILVWGSHLAYDAEAIDRFMDPARPAPAPLEMACLVDAKGICVSLHHVVAKDGSGLIEVLRNQHRGDFAFDMTGVLGEGLPLSIDRRAVTELGGFDTNYVLRYGILDLVLRAATKDPGSVVLRGAMPFVQERAPAEFGRPEDRVREEDEFARKARYPVGLPLAAEGPEARRLVEPRRHVAVKGTSLVCAPMPLVAVSKLSRAGGLRIQIRCPAPDDETKKYWGDLHFAQSLAEAFAEQGHTPDIRLRTHWTAPSPDVDVALHIRGIVDVKPVPGALNVLWVISHADKITQREVEAVDLVVVCSAIAAEEVRRRFGIHCEVLPQATDARRFAFLETPPKPSLQDRLVFIGNSRRQPRRIVLDALELGVDLDVYGREWEFYVPPGVVKNDFVPNEQVAAYYRSAAAVLNDHWPNMARSGIVSNRLFDVVACGGIAISDEVEGISELFGDHVRTCSNTSDLRALIEGIRDWAPDVERRREKSREILAAHSFEARATQLIDLFLNW